MQRQITARLQRPLFRLAAARPLTLGTGVVTGAIQGSSDGVGTVNFNDNNTLAGNVGTSANSLLSVAIASGKTVSVGSNNIDAATISLASSSVLTLGAGTLTGAVDGSSAGVGTVNLNSTNTLASGTTLGSTNGLLAVTVGNGATITANDSIKATTLTVGGGASGSLSLAASKSITGNAAIASGATLTLNGSSSVSGTINGSSSGVGTLSVAGSSVTVGGAIGATNTLASVSIASGADLTAGGNISATSIGVAGTLNLGNTSRAVSGSITGSGSATISAGQGSHTISGAFTTAANNILQLEVMSSLSAGSITSSGVATVASDTSLNVTVGSGVSVASGSTYNIVSGGSGSSITAIGNSSININGTGSNRYGLIAFTTSQSGNNLVLIGTKVTSAVNASNPSTQNAVTAIDSVDTTSGELLTMQTYINSDSHSNAQKDAAVKSTTPQTDNGTHKNAFSVANASIDTAEERLKTIRTGVASGDDAAAQGMWIQGFGGAAKQRSNSQSDGYHAQSKGFEIGADHEVFEDGHVGVSVSQTGSKVKSKVGAKSINVSTYQANIYGGVNFDHFFIDGLAGLALNRYSSYRAIATTNSQADANYSGHTAIAKIEAGWIKDLGKGFNVTPVTTFTYARNQVNNYSESGAGTLNLAVKTATAEFFEGRVGMDVGYNFLTANGTKINPEINLSYGYDFVGAKQVSTSNFVGQNTFFTSAGSNIYRGSLRAGAGLNIYRVDAITISLDYGFEHKTNYKAHSGDVRLRYDF